MTLPTIHDANDYSLDNRRRSLARMRDLHYHQIKFGWRMGVAACVIACACLLLAAALTGAPAPAGPLLIVAAGFCAWGAKIAWSRSMAALRLQRDEVYLPAADGHDPNKAIQAVDAMNAAIKTGEHKLQRLVDDAVSRLQRLRPGTPLSHLVRNGYYPSRPTEWSGDVRVTIDRDADAFESHWNRMSTALDGLRGLLHGDTVITERQVDEALAKLVPPMRAVLRTMGADTSVLEYIPGAKVQKRVKGEGKEIGRQPSAPDTPADAPREDDALSPVESRLNASATMTAASLRTLMLAFRSANPGLFLGEDRTTASLLVDRHLPDLVSAYAVAHDAVVGEERDQIRAEFARTLATVRDTLQGVMDRHVLAARQALEDQGRFIETRHGHTGLEPLS